MLPLRHSQELPHRPYSPAVEGRRALKAKHPVALPPMQPCKACKAPSRLHARARVSNLNSPAFPPVPDNGTSPMQGIETPETADNLPQGIEQ